MTTPSPHTPPPFKPQKSSGPLPPPAIDPQSLPYFVPPPPVGWAVVGSYSTAAWHAARALLAKREIVARMGKSFGESTDIELLVPLANEAYARSLLAGGTPSVVGGGPSPGGFPVLIATEPPASSPIPFATPIQRGLTSGQVLSYNIALVVLWLTLIVVSILTLLAFFLPG